MLELWFSTSAPISSSMTVLTLLTIAYTVTAHPRLAWALAISLVSAKIATFTGLAALQGHVMFICALICVIEWRGGWQWVSVKAKPIYYVVAALYVARSVVVLAHLAGYIEQGVMWLVLMLGLLMQLLLIIGMAHNGGTALANVGINNNRNNRYDLAFKKKRVND